MSFLKDDEILVQEFCELKDGYTIKTSDGGYWLKVGNRFVRVDVERFCTYDELISTTSIVYAFKPNGKVFTRKIK